MDRALRIKVILDAVGNAAGALKGIGGAAKAVARELKSAHQEVDRLKKAQSSLAQAKALQTEIVDLGIKLSGARERAAALRKEFTDAAQPSDRLAAKFRKAREEVGGLDIKMRDQARTLGEVRAKLAEAGVNVDRMSDAERDLKQRTEAANLALQVQKDRMVKLNALHAKQTDARATASAVSSGGIAAVGAGIAIAAPLVGATRNAMGFEDAMADVRKVVNFDTPRQFDQMRADVIALSKTFPRTKEGIAQIYAAAGQAGVPLGQLREFATDAIKMAVAFDIDDQAAGTMLATWRTGFRATQPEVVALADKINYLGNTGPANAAKISDIVTRVGALGEVAGLAPGPMAALGATLGGVGVESEIAATGIKNTLLALTKGSAATKLQSAAFKALGLDATDVAKRMQQDAGATILDVMKRISGLSKDRQAGVLTQLFGSESVSAIAPLLTNLQLLEGNLQKVGDKTKYVGAMDKEYATRAATTANAVALAKNNASALSLAIGDRLLPMTKWLADTVSGVTDAIGNWVAKNPELSGGIAIILGVVAALLVALGALAVIVAAVLAPFAALQVSLALAGPMFTAAAGAVSTFTGALLANPIFLIVAAIALLAFGVYEIVKHWKPIVAWLSGVWSAIKTAAANAIMAVIGYIMNFTPLGGFIRAFAAVWPWFTRLGARFLHIGGLLVSGLIDGFRNKLGDLKSAIVDAAKKAVGWFKDVLGIKSPSRVFAGLGRYTMAGLAVGLREGEREPLDRVRRTAARLTAAMVVGAAPAVAWAATPPAAVPRLPPPAAVSAVPPTRPDGPAAGALPPAAVARALPPPAAVSAVPTARPDGPAAGALPPAAVARALPPPAVPAPAVAAARLATPQGEARDRWAAIRASLDRLLAALGERPSGPASGPPAPPSFTPFGRPPPPAAPSPASATSAPAGGDHYELHFHAAPGADERDLFRMFEDWMRRRDADRRLSSLHDDGA